MPCYSPQKAYYSREVNPSGKRSLVWDKRKAIDDQSITIPCGQCDACRLERSRQWAIRCAHEASLYEKSCFLTLTYAPENLPFGGTLAKKHMQDFEKRLRKYFEPDKLRLFGCGEYGERTSRPHYHLCVMNADFNDKIHHSTHNENKLYTSETLDRLWKLGHCKIGSLTFESAAYVARYVTKKFTGKNAERHYEVYVGNGEIIDRVPEFPIHPRRPGLGKPWLEKFETDIYPDDFVVMNGKKMRPPKYYDAQLQKTRPYEFDEIKQRREQHGKQFKKEQTHERLLVKEIIHQQKIKLLKRSYESNDT